MAWEIDNSERLLANIKKNRKRVLPMILEMRSIYT